jgi:hypothetical protein
MVEQWGVKGDGIKDLGSASGWHAEQECRYHGEHNMGKEVNELNYEGWLAIRCMMMW